MKAIDRLSEMMNEALPRCSWATLEAMGAKFRHEPSVTGRAELESDLSAFMEPTGDLACRCCGASRGGFEWGITHGEGACYRCGWPARAYHYAETTGGKKMVVVNAILQYHPDELKPRPTADEDAPRNVTLGKK